jgi:NADPH-dependent 2,4-dienoyl-CoA reductase/sulfur reductase-like enzyme
LSAPDRTAGIVVVGASLAGLRGAEALRRGGYDGPLTLIGDEPYRPYDRPPLSKHVLSGEVGADRTELPATTALKAQWRLGHPAVALDRGTRSIRLASGEVIPFEKLLIATGARARPWPVTEGPTPEGVFCLRSRDDAAALRCALARKPRRILIVGAGLIGCEAASCCHALGLAVTLVDPHETPLSRALGGLIGQVVAERAEQAGVDFRGGVRVVGLEQDGAGRLKAARLSDGAIVEADVLIAALGATRDVSWLAGADLMADAGGVTCDAVCRVLLAIGEPSRDIYAAGDVARWPNAIFDGEHMAIEHWGNAVDQAAHAARNMLASEDRQAPYVHLPAFWSSQFGVNIKFVGSAEGADEVAVARGSLRSHRFLAVYGKAGRTVAAVSFDEARWLPAYAEKIMAGEAFPPISGGADLSATAPSAPNFPQRRAEPRPMNPVSAHG